MVAALSRYILIEKGLLKQISGSCLVLYMLLARNS